MLIETEHLSHVYAAGTPLARQALRNVNLTITPGERVGIAGKTGSGKSTLMLHIAGLLEPTLGVVRLDGVAAHARSRESRRRRRRVGIAFQYPEEQVFEQSVAREVAFGPRNLGLAGPEVEVRVNWALELVGLEPDAFRDRSPFGLSGGELRGVALARTLAMRPEVLILDEPTAGLDPRGRAGLLGQISACQPDEDATLVVVSHDLATLGQLVDRTIILQAGEIAADGPTTAILSDLDTLTSLGLEPPPVVDLLHALRAQGWTVATDRLLPEDAAAEIARALSSRSTGHEPGGDRP